MDLRSWAPTCASQASARGPHQVSGKRAGPRLCVSAPAIGLRPLPADLTGAVWSAYKTRPLRGASSRLWIRSIADSTQQFALFSSASWKALQSLHLAGNASDLVSQTGVPSTCPAVFPGHTSQDTGSCGWKKSASRSTPGQSNPPYLEFESVH